MNRSALNTTVKLLIVLGTSAVVQAFWVAMEMAVYGTPRPSGIDTVIGVVLTLSLYCNLRHYIRFSGEEPT